MWSIAVGGVGVYGVCLRSVHDFSFSGSGDPSAGRELNRSLNPVESEIDRVIGPAGFADTGERVEVNFETWGMLC
jgi:hypothetical protein